MAELLREQPGANAGTLQVPRLFLTPLSSAGLWPRWSPWQPESSTFLFSQVRPALLAMGGAVVDEGPTGVKAPDGGWGWAVLFGCFIITGFSYAFPKAVSVFFKELMHEFGIGYSDTAWISSILLAMLYGTGKVGPTGSTGEWVKSRSR